MLETHAQAPEIELPLLRGTELHALPSGKPFLFAFIETDCPTCRLTLPYLDRLSQELAQDGPVVLAVSQDGSEPTAALADSMDLRLPVLLDPEWKASRLFDPVAVPTLFLVDGDGTILDTLVGFEKAGLNRIAERLCRELGRTPLMIAAPYDGAPESKPGCSARHREDVRVEAVQPADAAPRLRARRASRVELDDSTDPWEYAQQHYGDPLPVVPPTVERVERMLAATTLAPEEVVARVPPNYGEATAEKIAANAVMAGCRPEMMRVLVPLLRAACDERFNLHGVQATTHFAAPLTIVNGPVRRELGFASGSNALSNVARANSNLGRALQLVLTNLGGARPGEIDMSTLGNPGKFSYCIAENEEENPWEPLHVERGFRREDSTVTLFAAEPPRGVSEHLARTGKQVLRAISWTLATIWNLRICGIYEAVVLLCPEHARTVARDGFTKESAREFLYDNAAVPLRLYRETDGEGPRQATGYAEVVVDGEPCYRKFRSPESITLVVCGGTAGKFSAVVGSWATGPRGSQMVTYPVDNA